jgi:hypothetical protein
LTFCFTFPFGFALFCFCFLSVLLSTSLFLCDFFVRACCPVGNPVLLSFLCSFFCSFCFPFLFPFFLLSFNTGRDFVIPFLSCITFPSTVFTKPSAALIVRVYCFFVPFYQTSSFTFTFPLFICSYVLGCPVAYVYTVL